MQPTSLHRLQQQTSRELAVSCAQADMCIVPGPGKLDRKALRTGPWKGTANRTEDGLGEREDEQEAAPRLWRPVALALCGYDEKARRKIIHREQRKKGTVSRRHPRPGVVHRKLRFHQASGCASAWRYDWQPGFIGGHGTRNGGSISGEIDPHWDGACLVIGPIEKESLWQAGRVKYIALKSVKGWDLND